MGASSQMMMPVCFKRPSWSEFFFKLQDDDSWREMGILKQECAVRPPSKRREATQRKQHRGQPCSLNALLQQCNCRGKSCLHLQHSEGKMSCPGSHLQRP